MTVLLFQHLRKCAASFIVSGEKSAVICVVFSQRSLFKIFFFILRFKKFDLIYLDVDILGFTQFIVCSVISICRFIFFAKFAGQGRGGGGGASHYFLKCLFIPALDIFSSWDFDNTNARFFFIIVSLVCEPLLIIPGYFPSVQFGKFLLFYIQLYWSFFSPFCYWAIHWVFIVWLLHISALKFPLGLLRPSIYFLRDFCLFVSSIYKCCWNILSRPLYTLCQIILTSLSSQW